MIPDGWKRKSLGEVITLQRGFDLPEQDRIHGTIPIISSSGISGFHNESKVRPPGIVTGRYGTIGKVFIVDVDFWPLNTSLWVKDFYGNDHRYVYYLLQSIDYQKLSDKTGVPGINRNDVHKVRVLLPPLSEQCKIAEVLGVWDESIDLLEKLIGKTRSRKQGLMQQLLTGKKRFKAFEGSEWETKKLKDIGKIVSGGTPDTNNPDYWNGDIPWCTPSEITALKDRYIQFTGRTISNEGVKSSSTAIMPVNSLLVCTRATIGYSAINIVPMCTNQGFKNLIPNKLISVEFLYYKICLDKHKLFRLASGSTFLEISKKDFEMIEIEIPSLPEQEKIAAVLSAADEEISTLEKQLAAYKQQKLGLMQQLLTGRIRI